MSTSMRGHAPQVASGQNTTDWTRELAPLGSGRLKVIIDVSNKCNLRCRMCHFSFDQVFHQPAHHMRPETFARIAASVLPNAHTLVLSAGNEPLMSPWFVDILRLMAGYHIPEVYFVTNAQLLTEKVADAIIETGVNQVQISADGATKQTYEYIRRGARFETLVRNTEHLTNRKRALFRSLPRLQFNVVLMKSNLEELDRYVDLAEELGVEWIAARHLLQVSGLGMEHESLTHDRKRANHYFKRFLQRAHQSNHVTVVSFPDLFDGEQFQPIEPAARPQSTIPAPSAATRSRRSVPAKIGREIRRLPRNVSRLFGLRDCPQNRKAPKRDPLLPRGAVDFPAESDLEVNNAIDLQGWVSDHQQVRRVIIERERVDFDDVAPLNNRGRIPVGEAAILAGARPDPPGTFQRFPHRCRLGWDFQLHREMVSSAEHFAVVVYAVAENVAGHTADIGQRTFTFTYERSAKPYLFCSKPFDSVLVDSRGNVSPYPDCRVPMPYGSLDGSNSFTDIWYGDDFSDLRSRIINRDPPPMCLSCAHFINRNVDDPAYFAPR